MADEVMTDEQALSIVGRLEAKQREWHQMNTALAHVRDLLTRGKEKQAELVELQQDKAKLEREIAQLKTEKSNLQKSIEQVKTVVTLEKVKAEKVATKPSTQSKKFEDD